NGGTSCSGSDSSFGPKSNGVVSPNQIPNPNGNGGTNGGNGGAAFVTKSLYVGDLDFNVKDSQIYDLDLTTRRSLGYGYVNFSNPSDGINLDKAIDHKSLHDTFSSFGNILSCKIATDSDGQSKGFGFVQFDTEEAAQKAIEKLNGMLINENNFMLDILFASRKGILIRNLSESIADEDLKKVFGEFGPITSAVVMRDADGKSRCFGFVNIDNADDAANAVEALNGKKFDDKEWYVGKAQKKSEREQELKGKFEQSMKEAADKYQGANLYVKNLDDTVDDEKPKELFAEYGKITSCKVCRFPICWFMRDPSGISKGFGFVAFSSPDEFLELKPLYVALAQRKEEEYAQFSQMRPMAMTPPAGPRMLNIPSGSCWYGTADFLWTSTTNDSS
ncbi:Polyadenylate-binding protein 2, partial [Bienertia sinuspersici]